MGLDNIYATTKARLAEEWMRRHPNMHILMLGDTIHDYEVAKLMDATCILIEGGHQTCAVLKSAECQVVHNLFEIITLFSE